MGTGDTFRGTGNTALLTGLISRTQKLIEDHIDRNIELQAAATIKIHDGRYCSIIENKIFLKDRYFDIYSITSLKEDGTLLVEGTDFVINGPNCIERIGAYWSQSAQLNIEIVGTFGLGYIITVGQVSTTYANEALKQILIECVAIRSGLWDKVVADGEGNEFTISKSSLPKITSEQLEAYRQYVA
jgi:hypothetical protein